MFAEGTRLAVTAQVYANYCGCLPKALGSQSLLRSMQTTVDVCCVTGLDFPTTKASPRYCICTENVMWMFAKVTRLIVQVSANYCGCLPRSLDSLLRSRQTTADVCQVTVLDSMHHQGVLKIPYCAANMWCSCLPSSCAICTAAPKSASVRRPRLL